ncbi:hypothetical protein JB92DRAFT_3040853 [Gautieria morchelliformis]|nr:hypothetical protein JB92DRAFT_3040853 [Gautieria morchelliformis]
MAMRKPAACRYSSIATVLVAVNLAVLFFYFSFSVQDYSWGWNQSSERSESGAPPREVPQATLTVTAVTTATAIEVPQATLTVTAVTTAAAIEVPQATLTITAVTTSTAIVEAVRPPSPPKIPGPPFCDVCSSDDHLCTLYGEHNLARSRVYEGANARFRRVIANALAGKPTKIGVLGGSVTKGHGVSHTESWTTIFLDSWNKLFPKSKTTFINGAVPATGSDYFSMCFGEHIDEDVDLVIVELLINDQRLESNALANEWLLRGLLGLPKNPAVINLYTIGLSFETITTGGDLHTPISAYYDVPVVSARNMLAPHIFKHAKLDEYYFTKTSDGTPDWRHVGAPGHKVMGDLLVAYTQRQICAVEREKAKPTKYTSDGTLPGTEGLDTIPRLRLFQKYDRETITDLIKPTCSSVRTTKHPLTPIEAKGWERWVHQEYKDKPYLVGKEPGSIFKVEVTVGPMGRVRITYLKSKTFGLGDAWCWLDDDRKGGKRVVSWWNLEKYNLAQVAVVTDTATPGKHVLTCEIMKETSDPGGGHEFRLIAVDAS